MGQSTAGSKTIYKQSKDGLNVDGLYRMLVINPTTSTVNINDMTFGSIPVPANSSVQIIDAHPDYPMNVAITIVFAEGVPNSDNITIIYIRVV